MADGPLAAQAHLQQEQQIMLGTLMLLAFSLLVGVLSLAIVVWVLASGRFPSLDSLSMILLALLFAVIFGGNFAWSAYKGEAQQVFKAFLHRRTGGDPL